VSRYTRHPGLAAEIGRRARARRSELGMSQRAVCDAVGVGDGTISRYEKGEHSPSLETLCLLALALDLEPADLLPTSAELAALGIKVLDFSSI
jgi:transcriptional regulator with XRE-family HTH domain